MLITVTIGYFKLKPADDEIFDANVVIETDGIRMIKMVRAEEQAGYVVEINYSDGDKITLGAHVPEIGETLFWDQAKCAEIIEAIYDSYQP